MSSKVRVRHTHTHTHTHSLCLPSHTEYMCHEGGGASVLAYSHLKQRMFSGGKRGEVCIFDIRQNALIQSLSVHTSAITCMEVNDVEGYIVTGSTEGDIKVSVERERGGVRVREDGRGGGRERE